MNIEIITKDNIKDIVYDNVIIIFFAESGAIGEAGRVDIITREKSNYKWYKTNYTFIGVTEIIENLSDIAREEQKLFNILPILKELNFNHSLIRESYQIDNKWHLYDLGFGNHILISDKKLIENLSKSFSNHKVIELYKIWEDIVKEELKNYRINT